jgi:hypothetical protein
MAPIELGVICFAGFALVMLLVIRAKRAHDQKLRRAASAGFYDFDVARYGTASAGSSLMEKSVEASTRPLAPSFTSADRGADHKRGAVAPAAPAPIPSSFGVIDRSLVTAVPAYDQKTAEAHRPPEARPAAETINTGLPIPSTLLIPPIPDGPSESDPVPTSSLPPLVQPPPPAAASPSPPD